MMISYRHADLLRNLQYRDVDVTVIARVGESPALPPSAPFFVQFQRPQCENEAVRESTDTRLRGILEAKSYVKRGDAFILDGFPSRGAAESSFFDVFKYLKHHNSVLSCEIDQPVKQVPGSKTKEMVIRMRTRG